MRKGPIEKGLIDGSLRIKISTKKIYIIENKVKGRKLPLTQKQFFNLNLNL